MAIKFRLDEIMEEENLTIQDVHEMTEISRNTISQMINKKPKGIQFDTLDKLVSSLDVEVSSLIKHIPENKKQAKVVNPNKGSYYPIVRFKEEKSIMGVPIIDEVLIVFELNVIINNMGVTDAEYSLPIGARAKFTDKKVKKAANHKEGKTATQLKMPFAIIAEITKNAGFLKFLKCEDKQLFNKIYSDIEKIIVDDFVDYYKWNGNVDHITLERMELPNFKISSLDDF